jgi:lipoate-protein ligase A
LILWIDGRHDPAENMRRDAALLGDAEQDHPPVLRLFGFEPAGITLGCNQDPAHELDLERCSADGVPWAVRPTGGRAIFHAEEWTYALVTPIDDPEWGGSPARVYDRMSRLLVRSLQRLGVPAELARGSSRRSDPMAPRRAKGPVPPCFASTAKFEVTIGGRKLAGSAQRRTATAVLQQGSVLLGEGHLRLADYLAAPAAERAGIRRALREATAHAGSWLGAEASLARWADAIEAELGTGSVARCQPRPSSRSRSESLSAIGTTVDPALLLGNIARVPRPRSRAE